MPRPSDFPVWTDGAPTKVVVPPGSKQLQGWEVESPPFQYMNWLFWLINEWLVYLDTVVGGSAVNISADSIILSTTGDILIGSYKMTNIASITNLEDGMLIDATGVPAGTYVVSHDATSAIMSRPATANLPGNATDFIHGIADGANIQRQLDELDAYADWMTTPVVLGTTGDTTNGSDQLVNLASTTGIKKGQLIVKTGVPANTYVADLTGSTVTMTKKATTTAAAAETTFIHQYATVQGKESLDQLDQQAYENMGPATQGTSATITATQDLTGAHIGQVVKVNTSAGAISLNLMRPLAMKNKTIIIQDVGGALSSNALTLARFGAENIALIGANYFLRGDFGTWYLWSDGTDYFLI